MQKKISLKLSLLVIGISLAISSLFFVTFLIPVPDIPAIPYTQPIPIPPVISQDLQNLIDVQSSKFGSSTTKQTVIGLPIRLKIPKINVDASVIYVGLTSSGAMDIPKGPDEVAWFNLGPRPGENGSAVIDGHFGWKNNIPAVFDNLYKLKKGDKIYIEDDAGKTITFVVIEIGLYNQNGDASNVFGSNDEKAHLNLITCEGIWNATQKSYSNRLVVFSDKE